MSLAGAWLLQMALAGADADPVAQAWLQRIQAIEGAGCALGEPAYLAEVVGNNGMRLSTWRVPTCHGPAHYRLAYWPRQFFPDRPEFEVVPSVAPPRPPPPGGS